MAIDLADYERKAREAVRAFWGNREKARQNQIESGKADQGERGGITAGKNMDGFTALVIDIVHANGLDRADIHYNGRILKRNTRFIFFDRMSGWIHLILTV